MTSQIQNYFAFCKFVVLSYLSTFIMRSFVSPSFFWEPVSSYNLQIRRIQRVYLELPVGGNRKSFILCGIDAD